MHDAEPALPEPLAQAWRSLAKADELVQEFAARGWIAEEARAVVDRRTADIARRAGRLEGGVPGTDEGLASLRRDMGELTALLVALSDAAVAAQPSLAPEQPVPVTMADAQHRLADTADLLDDA